MVYARSEGDAWANQMFACSSQTLRFDLQDKPRRCDVVSSDLDDCDYSLDEECDILAFTNSVHAAFDAKTESASTRKAESKRKHKQPETKTSVTLSTVIDTFNSTQTVAEVSALVMVLQYHRTQR